MNNSFPADLTEIVFRNRNKAYGAYVLRKEYVSNTTKGLIYGAAFMIAAFLLPVAISAIKDSLPKEDIKVDETTLKLEEPPPMNEKEEPPPPPDVEPPPPPQRSEIKFVPPVVVKNEEAPPDKTITTIDSLEKTEADIGKKDVEGVPDAPPNLDNVEQAGTGDKPVEVAVVEADPDMNAFQQVSSEPSPVNMGDIHKRLVYPEVCKEAQIQGKVHVRILVDKEGNPTKFVVRKTPHPLLAKSVEAEVMKLKFKPAINAGKPVKCWVNIPFDFKLK